MAARVTATVLLALAVVSCGGGEDPDDDAATASSVATSAADETTGEGDDVAATGQTDAPTTGTAEPPPAPASEEQCGDPATPLELDAPVTAEAADGEPQLYCVTVPSGLSSLTVTLTGLADDLDLFVAHDTIDDLSEGLGLRFSDNNGTEDESVTIEPAAYRGELIGFDTYADVTPGPYWVEVVGRASSFTLTAASS